MASLLLTWHLKYEGELRLILFYKAETVVWVSWLWHEVVSGELAVPAKLIFYIAVNYTVTTYVDGIGGGDELINLQFSAGHT